MIVMACCMLHDAMDSMDTINDAIEWTVKNESEENETA